MRVLGRFMSSDIDIHFEISKVESEAAQVQAALMKLSTELGEAAATTLHPAAD